MLVAWAAVAEAAPKAGRKPAPNPEQAQLAKLDAQMRDAQIKQAYMAALKVAKQAYELQLKISGKDADETQRRLQTLAQAYNTAGDYGEARKLYQQVLAVTEKKKGPDSQDVEYVLMAINGTYWGQNRLDELEPVIQRELSIEKKLHGEHSLDYARTLMQLGMMYNARNEYTAAQRAYEQMLAIEESLLPKNDMQLVSPLQMVAYQYWQANNRPKAMALYDRMIQIAESQPNASAMTVGGTIWGVAAVYHYGKRDDLALPLMKKVIGMYDKEIAQLQQTKPDDYMLGSLLGMSGYLMKEMKDPRAEARLEEAIAYDEKHGRPSGWGTMLADLKRENGKLKEALALLEKAQAAMPKFSPMSGVMYNTQIAIVLREMGDYKRAEKLLVEYLAGLEKTYGRKHPIYGMGEFQLAFAYMGAGDVARAESVLADSLDIAERDLQNSLKVGTDADHAVYFSRYGYQLDSAINFNYYMAPKNASVTRLALTTLLRRKGRALDASAAAMATIRAKLSPDDKKLLDDLAAARAKLAKLTVAGPAATGSPDDYAKEVAALEDQIEKLELQVGQKSAAYRAATSKVELAPIQKLIPRDAKLVEIVNFQPGDPRKPYSANAVLPPRRYAAYVIGQTGDPVFVDLAAAPDIDTAVEKFRKAVSDPDNDRANELGRALYDLTVAKIQPALGKATEIFIAPDGTLNVVPFAALVDTKGEFLVKKYTFTYLTSGRDLLRVKARTKAQGGGLIFANPSFDASAPAPKAGDAPGSRGARSVDLASLSWPPLPGTGQEANAVASTMKGLKLFTGLAATETAVKKVHGPRILHLATHGFFLPDEAPPPAANDNRAAAAPGPANLAGLPQQAPVESGENPLLRSGLAFAGANKLASGEDDGILTALEASGLDLEGTKLVVLSACETGVGKVTNGDGVYGLRRALVIAGAESLVMSLWQVDDQATKDLMVGYYKRLARGESRSSALRDIQLELAGNKKYAHPYYWASFLPAGDNTPIKE
ncbi:MAG: CHAT domain-containing tetratricopeptide repeat protein [Acidobacteriota bacterium]